MSVPVHEPDPAEPFFGQGEKVREILDRANKMFPYKKETETMSDPIVCQACSHSIDDASWRKDGCAAIVTDDDLRFRCGCPLAPSEIARWLVQEQAALTRHWMDASIRLAMDRKS